MQRRYHKPSTSFIEHCANLRKNNKEHALKHQANETKKYDAGMLRIERAALKATLKVKHDR